MSSNGDIVMIRRGFLEVCFIGERKFFSSWSVNKSG